MSVATMANWGANFVVTISFLTVLSSLQDIERTLGGARHGQLTASLALPGPAGAPAGRFAPVHHKRAS